MICGGYSEGASFFYQKIVFVAGFFRPFLREAAITHIEMGVSGFIFCEGSFNSRIFLAFKKNVVIICRGRSGVEEFSRLDGGLSFNFFSASDYTLDFFASTRLQNNCAQVLRGYFFRYGEEDEK